MRCVSVSALEELTLMSGIDQEFDPDRAGTYTAPERTYASVRDGLRRSHTRYAFFPPRFPSY